MTFQPNDVAERVGPDLSLRNPIEHNQNQGPRIEVKETRSEKFAGIQALRFIAASLVVITHSTYYAFERLDKRFSVWERGTRGVDIFFVISGFVMIYSSRKFVVANGGWKRFSEHRLMRVVPLYWLMTTLKVCILLGTAGFVFHARLSPVTVACSYLFLPSQNLDGKIEPLVGVGWTLNFEMLFYFLFATALYLRVNVYKLVGSVLMMLAIGAYFRQASWPPAAFYLHTIVLEFFGGMLIARLCLNGKFLSQKLVAGAMVCGFTLLLLPPHEWSGPKALISGLPAMLILWSAVSLGEFQLAIPRWFLYFGEASYSIYLIHPFICPLPPTLLSRLHLDLPVLSTVMSVLLGLGVGCVLHEIVEKPLTSYLKGCFSRLPRASAHVSI